MFSRCAASVRLPWRHSSARRIIAASSRATAVGRSPSSQSSVGRQRARREKCRDPRPISPDVAPARRRAPSRCAARGHCRAMDDASSRAAASAARRFGRRPAPRQEMLGQRHDVGQPLPQRRHMHRNHVEPVEQILAERAVAHRAGEVAMGRGDDRARRPPPACRRPASPPAPATRAGAWPASRGPCRRSRRETACRRRLRESAERGRDRAR